MTFTDSYNFVIIAQFFSNKIIITLLSMTSIEVAIIPKTCNEKCIISLLYYYYRSLRYMQLALY